MNATDMIDSERIDRAYRIVTTIMSAAHRPPPISHEKAQAGISDRITQWWSQGPRQ